MDYYAGIDVALEYSSVCVVDGGGKIIGEGKVARASRERWSSTLRRLGRRWRGSAWRLDLCRNGFMRR